ncbi:hypothetical protein BDQ17DRAFT_784455 [Cyathus striatus]|nr:hypothetical protein BDQ17DRAFT_784455 [Cyathus striatus]
MRRGVCSSLGFARHSGYQYPAGRHDDISSRPLRMPERGGGDGGSETGEQVVEIKSLGAHATGVRNFPAPVSLNVSLVPTSHSFFLIPVAGLTLSLHNVLLSQLLTQCSSIPVSKYCVPNAQAAIMFRPLTLSLHNVLPSQLAIYFRGGQSGWFCAGFDFGYVIGFNFETV